MRHTFLLPVALCLALAACGGSGSDASTTTPPPPPTDTTPPDTTLDSVPPASTTANSATFKFSASESGATFEASLDGAAYATATSPVSLSALAAGTHTFSVRARDTAGNVDPTPATFTWAIDLVPPSARIIFPTPLSYTTASTLNVRGNANDANGVSAVSVNGVAATSTDGFQHWQAVVPITAGDNTLSVTVTDTAGNVATSAATAQVTNNGPANYQLAGLDYDPAGDRIVAADGDLNAIYYYKTTDGGIAHVLSPTPGAANGQYGPADLAIDAPRNRAILVEGFLDALIAVDLATGARSVISATMGSAQGTMFTINSAIALDTANNRAFVSNPQSNVIIGVDLATGIRSVVASATVGSGDAINRPACLVYDNVSTPGTPRLLVGQGGDVNGMQVPPEIMAVDLSTGDRAAAFPSSPQTPAFPLDTPVAIRIDAANSRLLVLDRRYAAIQAIDLATGTQALFTGGLGNSGLLVDGGPLLNFSARLALDPVAPGTLFADSVGGALISIDLSDTERSLFASSRAGTGLTLNYPTGIAVEQAVGTPASLLLADSGTTRLIRVELATGIRTAVSDSTAGVGTGPSLLNATDVVLDTRASANGHTALVLVSSPVNQLLSVDLATGDRTSVADLNSTAPAVSNVSHLRLDTSGNRVLFTDSGNNALYAIDLGTGARITITDSSHGTGPNFTFAANLVLDPAVNPTRALVSDLGLGGIIAVDLASGNRSYLIQPFANIATPGDNVPSGLWVDSANSRLLAVRVGAVSNLFSVALSSGTQQILSGADPTTTTLTAGGPLPLGCLALDVSTTDGVAFLACPWIGSVVAIDLLSGDRVFIAR